MGHERARPVRGPTPAEAGVSLVEVVVSVAIMGLAVVAIAMALTSSVRHSDVAAGRSRAEAEARRLAEHLRSEDVDLVACDEARDRYTQVVENDAAHGFEPEIGGIWWSESGIYPSEPSEDCGGDVPKLLRVELTVRDRASDASATVVVVKREPNVRG